MVECIVAVLEWSRALWFRKSSQILQDVVETLFEFQLGFVTRDFPIRHVAVHASQVMVINFLIEEGRVDRLFWFNAIQELIYDLKLFSKRWFEMIDRLDAIVVDFEPAANGP